MRAGVVGLFDRWSVTYDHGGLILTYRPIHDAMLERPDDIGMGVSMSFGATYARSDSWVMSVWVCR